MKAIPLRLMLAFCTVAGVQNVAAQSWTQPYTSSTAVGNCEALPANLSSSDFVIEPVISRALFTETAPARILKMAFWLNPETHKADIILAEKGSNNTEGRVLYYDAHATPPTLTAIGTIPDVYRGFNESGVFGLAVNPMTFAEDNFLYIAYATGTSANASPTNGWRISRFTLHPTTRMMDLASEKILLHIPAGTSGRWHTVGSLRFDNFGNLYISTGDNEATARGPGATGDLRGSILRITPDDSERGYSIPEGNFGEYWAARWESMGLANRAADYRDTALVKPEIYVKGVRNPYVINVDPNRLGVLNWSDCGPDFAGQRGEDHVYTTAPVFAGWPFWKGVGVRQGAYAANYDEAGPTNQDPSLNLEPRTSAQWNAFNPVGMLPELPINNWEQKVGVDTLPPVHMPYHTTTNGCAMGGPLVRYDGRIDNPDKLPPHLDNVIISHNFAITNNNFYAVQIDTVGDTAVGAATTVFTMSKTSGQPSLRNLVEFALGPDGVLYGVDWGAGCCNGDRGTNASEGVVRLRYAGTCQDPGLHPPTSINAHSSMPLSRDQDVSWLTVGSKMFSVFTQGPHEAVILDMRGRVLHTFRGNGPRNYSIPELGAAGVHVLQVRTMQGMAVRTIAAF